MKKIISLFIILVFIVSCTTVNAIEETSQSEAFIRGVWVSSVLNLDFPSAPGLSDAALRAEIDSIVKTCVNTGMNTVFFQVRPCADALYNSAVFPVSTYLTGRSSYDRLSFDPLEYFIKKAHESGIKLHAWLNPYRVTRNPKEMSAISELSPARRHPEYLLHASDGNYFFDPALPEVQQLILDGVREIIENYDVDGIHFDDYFYPDSSYDDSKSFAAYGSGYSSVGEWRTENVNTLVRRAHELIKGLDPSVEFGISPRGIWANDYDNSKGSATRGSGSLTDIHCDSLRFIKEGWVDYICPQIYWNIGYSIADYQILVPWWIGAVSGTNVKLYIGMADYRSAEAASGNVWQGTAELQRQLNLNKTYPQISGEVHFRYGSIAKTPALYEFYRQAYGRLQQSSAAPNAAPDISFQDLLNNNIVNIMHKILSA